MRTKADIIRQAQQDGSTAKTFRGALRFLQTHPRPVRVIGSGYGRGRAYEALAEAMGIRSLAYSWDSRRITAADYRRHAWSVRMDLRAARVAAARGVLDRAGFEALAAETCASLGLLDREQTKAAREAELVAAAKPLTAIMRAHSPVPAVVGAGDKTERVVLRDGIVAPHTRCDTTFDRYSSRVAKSYGYAVRDYEIDYVIPSDHTVIVVAGVATVVAVADVRRARREPVRAYWPRKSRGYTAEFVAGWLYRDSHVRAGSARAARTKVERIRRKAAERAIERRAKGRRQASGWITESDLREVGACAPGIDAGRKALEAALGAVGPVGAVLASYAVETYPAGRSWIDRAAK